MLILVSGGLQIRPNGCAPARQSFRPPPVTEQKLVLTQRTNGPYSVPKVATAAAHAVTARMEAEVARADRVARVE